MGQRASRIVLAVCMSGLLAGDRPALGQVVRYPGLVGQPRGFQSSVRIDITSITFGDSGDAGNIACRTASGAVPKPGYVMCHQPGQTRPGVAGQSRPGIVGLSRPAGPPAQPDATNNIHMIYVGRYTPSVQ